LFTGRKLFQNDFAVFQYSTSDAALETIVDVSMELFNELIKPMLHKDAHQRPSARALLNVPDEQGVHKLRTFACSDLAYDILEWATQAGETGIVQSLMNIGVWVTSKSLKMAVKHGKTSIVKAFIKSGNIFLEDMLDALYSSLAKGDTHMGETLLLGGYRFDVDEDQFETVRRLKPVANGNGKIAELLLAAGFVSTGFYEGGLNTEARSEHIEMQRI
jgi:hypothetical protein